MLRGKCCSKETDFSVNLSNKNHHWRSSYHGGFKPELWICQVIFIDYTIHKRYLVYLPLKSCSPRIIALWSYTEFGRAYYLILTLFNLVIELLQILSLWETSVWNLPMLFWKLKARQAQWPSSKPQLCPMQALLLLRGLWRRQRCWCRKSILEKACEFLSTLALTSFCCLKFEWQWLTCKLFLSDVQWLKHLKCASNSRVTPS